MATDAFARRIIDLHGETGRRWLAGLPTLIDECAQRWALTVEAPFANLSYNYAAPALRQDGEELVLKLGVPHPELTGEIAALRVYDGRGAVRLLEGDAARGILLMQRLRPGVMLSELEDDAAATVAAAQVMRDLWRPLPQEGVEHFKTVGSWAQGMQKLRQTFEGGCGPFPATLVDLAERLFAELLASMDAPVLLHGDLHHFNILSAGAGRWLAIDPKGVAGEPAYEVGALMRNPFPLIAGCLNLRRTLERRADILADELGFDRQRILGWSLAQAVLAAWWTYEDDGHYEKKWLTIAEALSEIVRSRNY